VVSRTREDAARWREAGGLVELFGGLIGFVVMMVMDNLLG